MLYSGKEKSAEGSKKESKEEIGKERKKFQSIFFKNPRSNLGKISNQNKAQLLWERAYSSIQREQFVDAVLCCVEGYQASYRPIDILTVPIKFKDLITTYHENKEFLLHIEFARLESTIVDYLIKVKDYDKLYELVKNENELALDFFASLILKVDNENQEEEQEEQEQEIREQEEATLEALSYIQRKINNSTQEVDIILKLSMNLKTTNFSSNFEIAAFYLNETPKLSPRLQLFLKAMMANSILEHDSYDKEYLIFLHSYLNDLPTNAHYLCIHPLMQNKFMAYPGLMVSGNNTENDQAKIYLLTIYFMKLGILKGDVETDSSAGEFYEQSITRTMRNVQTTKKNSEEINLEIIGEKMDQIMDEYKANNPEFFGLYDELYELREYKTPSLKLMKKLMDPDSSDSENESGNESNNESDSDSHNAPQNEMDEEFGNEYDSTYTARSYN